MDIHTGTVCDSIPGLGQQQRPGRRCTQRSAGRFGTGYLLGRFHLSLVRCGETDGKAGLTALLSRLFSPFLGRIFPSYCRDPLLAGYLCSNVCANFLGLGNAATPMGIQAAKRLSHGKNVASDELCRLIVLNTASIQLIPATVAAIRAQFGSQSPFDILPAVWLTSITSAGAGLLAAWCFGRLNQK